MPRLYSAALFGLLLTSLLSVLSASADTAPEVFEPGLYRIDSNYTNVRFTITNLGFFESPGVFNRITGKAWFDGKDITTLKVQARIIIDKLKTGIKRRDNHLKSKPLFNLKMFPKAYFDSTSVEPVSKGIFKLHGNLRIKTISKPVVLDVRGPIPSPSAYGRKAFTASAWTKINRKDFGLTEGLGGIGDIATLRMDVRIMQDPNANQWEDEVDDMASKNSSPPPPVEQERKRQH